MISVTILTKNNEETLGATLDAVASFPEVIVLDTGSTDRTPSMARTYPNVRFFSSPFIGFGPLHNLAASYATHDWILSIDSDEVLTQALLKELQGQLLDPAKVYSFPFCNFFNGKQIKWCGWYPDRHIRLYYRKATAFTSDQVHERIQTGLLEEVSLQSPIHHYSYRSLSDFLRKMETYTTLFAMQNAHKKQASLWTAILHGGYAFFKAYFLQRGFLGGEEGYLIARYQGQTAFYKYLKLAYVNRTRVSQDQQR